MTRAIPAGLLIALACQVAIGAPPHAELVRVSRIWDEAPHNAFTDLAHWKNRFWCAFREGRSHASTDGKIRILTSPDGKSWNSSSLIELEGFDLRDAGLSITPQGRLMLCGGVAPRKADGDSAPTGTFVAFSDDGKNWTSPQIVVEPGRWMWRVAWFDNVAYGISYAAPDGRPYTALLSSDDGIKFHELIPQLLGQGYPTEAALRFDDEGTLFVLQRRDGESRVNSAFLGVSHPPYQQWTWSDLNVHVGGPALIKLPSGAWVVAGRNNGPDGPRTAIAFLDMAAKKLTPLLELPSGGDTSYPGLVYHDGVLWISYYSSHEGKSNIYMAEVRVE